MDTTILEFLAAPFAAALVIAGIHAYLGVHVVERGVIFVDLSLAQIAALGSTIPLLLPFTDGDPHGPWTYWISLLFTFIGAAIFATIRSKKARVPQEAIIGISLCRGFGGGDAGHEQGLGGERTPEGHARGQHPRGLVGGGPSRRRFST